MMLRVRNVWNGAEWPQERQEPRHGNGMAVKVEFKHDIREIDEDGIDLVGADDGYTAQEKLQQ